MKAVLQPLSWHTLSRGSFQSNQIRRLIFLRHYFGLKDTIYSHYTYNIFYVKYLIFITTLSVTTTHIRKETRQQL